MIKLSLSPQVAFRSPRHDCDRRRVQKSRAISCTSQCCEEVDRPRTLGAGSSSELHRYLMLLLISGILQTDSSLSSDEYSDQPLFANTDMAKNWHQLGFVVQRPSSGPEPIFVETQRGTIHHHKKAISSPNHPSPEVPIPKRGGPLILPTPDPGEQPITTVESLRTHLQTAMAIELATIPLYLFAMYSVKIPKQYANDPRYYDPVIGAILGP